jgi:hypothetical protein
MSWVGKWVFRTVVVWAAGKAWQAYHEKKEREERAGAH